METGGGLRLGLRLRLRLRLPVLLRRLLLAGDRGVPAAVAVACSTVGERPPEGGGVSVLVTFLVADVVVSAVSDTWIVRWLGTGTASGSAELIV